MESKQVAAFIEYVARPLMEDAKLILDSVHKLNIPLTEQMLKKAFICLGLLDLIKEIIRSATYIMIAILLGKIAFQAILAYP